MKRCFLVLAVSLAVSTLLLPASLVHAAGKGKAKKSRSMSGAASSNLSFAPSNLGNSSGNPQGGFSTKKFKSMPHVNKQALSASANGNFSPTMKKFSQSNKSLKNLQTLGSIPTGGNLNNQLLNSAKLNSSITGRFSQSDRLLNQAKVADQVKVGGVPNIFQDNVANYGNVGRFDKGLTAVDRGKLADALKNGGVFPVGGGNEAPADNGMPEIGNEAPGQGGPGQGGGGGGNPPADPNDPNCPPNDHCDHHGHHHGCHFPWWPPIVIGGGCYHDGWYQGGCYNRGYCPPTSNITIIEQATASAPAVQPFVDLELVDVRFVDAGDPGKNLGIRYRIVFRNRGTLPVGNFQLLVMASDDGTPKPGAPSASAEIVGLAPGELYSIDVRLPVSPDLATMNALIVAIDSAVQIAELDEQNNVAVLDRTKIAVADLASVATP